MSTLHRLADEVEHPAPSRRQVPRWRLLLALVAAPAAFSLQVIASYVITSRLCGSGGAPRLWSGLVNVAAVSATVAGAVVAWRLWRTLRDESGGGLHAAADAGEGRTRFLALCAVLVSGIVGLAVLFDAGVLLVFGSCPGYAPVG